MAINITLEQPQPVSNISEDPDKATDDINRAIQSLQRNVEELRKKAKEE